MSFFENVKLAPPDPILGLTVAFHRDARPHKVNLGVGLFKDEELKTSVLGSVKSAEAALLDAEKSKEYLPIDGDHHYLQLMGNLVFGKDLWAKDRDRVAAFQTIGGTGALKIGGTFLKEEAEHPLLISEPTWPNHAGVFKGCGLSLQSYEYYDRKNHRVDFEKMAACFEKLEAGTIVVLHASCHNPTGSDPSGPQWEALADLFQKKRLVPFFDLAYQGFGRGLDADAESVRIFMGRGLEMLVAVSNAKNFSLYGERAGCLFISAPSEKIAEHISSRVKQMIRVNYSNPPLHGARTIAYVLSTPSLRKQWESELDQMRKRIQAMRLALHDGFSKRGQDAKFGHLKQGCGMFGFTGLTKAQVDRLINEFAIYMPSDGRINVCGLNQGNIDSVVDAMIQVSQ